MKDGIKKGFRYLLTGIVIGLLLITSACRGTSPSVSEVAFKTLSTAATSYEQTMKALGDYYKQGKISEETKEKIISAGEVYYGAYHSAVIAFEVYQRAGDLKTAADKAKLRADLDTALLELSNTLSEFLVAADSYIKEIKALDK